MDRQDQGRATPCLDLKKITRYTQPVLLSHAFISTLDLPPWVPSSAWLLDSPSSQMGIIPRAIRDIFLAVDESISVFCSFLQIYNDQPYDLIRDPQRRHPLKLCSKQSEMFVIGLSEYAVTNVTECLSVLEKGDEHRASRSTRMNDVSSRSHSIFQLILERKEENGTVIKSKLNLVDLAGSEKWGILDKFNKEHVDELTNINKSLHILGKCIAELSRKESIPSNRARLRLQNGQQAHPQQQSRHIPYRESKLTRMLQDSLGGNSRTVVVATLSPTFECLEETMSTLKFATRARHVSLKSKIVKKRVLTEELVDTLEQEIARLKQHIKSITEHQEETNLLSGSRSPTQSWMPEMKPFHHGARSNDRGIGIQEVESSSSTIFLTESKPVESLAPPLRYIESQQRVDRQEEVTRVVSDHDTSTLMAEVDRRKLSGSLWISRSQEKRSLQSDRDTIRPSSNYFMTEEENVNRILRDQLFAHSKTLQILKQENFALKKSLSKIQHRDERVPKATEKSADQDLSQALLQVRSLSNRFFSFEIEEETYREELQRLFQPLFSAQPQQNTETDASAVYDDSSRRRPLADDFGHRNDRPGFSLKVDCERQEESHIVACSENRSPNSVVDEYADTYLQRQDLHQHHSMDGKDRTYDSDTSKIKGRLAAKKSSDNKESVLTDDTMRLDLKGLRLVAPNSAKDIDGERTNTPLSHRFGRSKTPEQSKTSLAQRLQQQEKKLLKNKKLQEWLRVKMTSVSSNKGEQDETEAATKQAHTIDLPRLNL